MRPSLHADPISLYCLGQVVLQYLYNVLVKNRHVYIYIVFGLLIAHTRYFTVVASLPTTSIVMATSYLTSGDEACAGLDTVGVNLFSSLIAVHSSALGVDSTQFTAWIEGDVTGPAGSAFNFSFFVSVSTLTECVVDA